MDTTSYWLASATPKQFPALDKTISVDVLVVGGGITGITTAYLLSKNGVSVGLAERAGIGQIDTGHTTAHLTAVTDVELHKLVEDFGRDDAQAVWDAGAAAIDQIEGIVARENIACEFTRIPGFLHVPVEGDGKEEPQKLREDARLANEFGFDATFEDAIPFMNRPGVRFANQAKFHPIKYLAALAANIPAENGYVWENSRASEFDAEKRRARVNGHWVNYGALVLATHNPLVGESGLVSSTLFQTKLALYTTYAIGARVPRGSIPIASFWDTNDPYLYLRVDQGEADDYAILGGEDHKTGQVVDTQRCYERLRNSLGKIAPNTKIDHEWSGQVIETNDGLPFIGESDPGQFIATGFSGNGTTFGTLAAMMASDWIAQKKNPWRDLFDPSRKKLKGAAWDYVKENADYPYYLVKSRLAPSEGDSLGNVGRSEGRILKINGRKMAVFRDTEGNVTKRSAVCTHMGCIVRWNAAEATWDCPCHGSRFKTDGAVISGPAEAPLANP
jgi:glycine/D-amino acid oxidase-like deaminating enzyme/nitrite reductase/ring-hydroxylating ferredoxin subunit